MARGADSRDGDLTQRPIATVMLARSANRRRGGRPAGGVMTSSSSGMTAVGRPQALGRPTPWLSWW
jgi:hypothetical protein